jgi:hypothetical protein
MKAGEVVDAVSTPQSVPEAVFARNAAAPTWTSTKSSATEVSIAAALRDLDPGSRLVTRTVLGFIFDVLRTSMALAPEKCWPCLFILREGRPRSARNPPVARPPISPLYTSTAV